MMTHAQHAALREAVDAASNALDAMERGWRRAGNAEYDEVERRFFERYDALKIADIDEIKLPIVHYRSMMQQSEIIGRWIERSPDQPLTLDMVRRFCEHVKDWLRSESAPAQIRGR
jgi:hypothetical protein